MSYAWDEPTNTRIKPTALGLARSRKALAWVRAFYVGQALIKLKGWERSIDKAWREAGELAIADRVPAMLTIWKVYDGLLDRRRILCGDPLPRGGGSKTASRMIELEPQSIPADAMPEAAQADPVAGVD